MLGFGYLLDFPKLLHVWFSQQTIDPRLKKPWTLDRYTAILTFTNDNAFEPH